MRQVPIRSAYKLVKVASYHDERRAYEGGRVVRTMLSSVSTVTGLSILGQLVGFLRMSLIAAGLGISQSVDAYNLGLIIPALLITVISSLLQVLGVFYPLVRRVLQQPHWNLLPGLSCRLQ